MTEQQIQTEDIEIIANDEYCEDNIKKGKIMIIINFMKG